MFIIYSPKGLLEIAEKYNHNKKVHSFPIGSNDNSLTAIGDVSISKEI